MKVQDLAKELGKGTKEFIRFLAEVDIKAKSGSTRLEEETVSEIRELFKGETPNDKDTQESIVLTEERMTVGDLAKRLGISIPDILKSLLQKGLLLNLNSEIDQNRAKEIADEFEIPVEITEKKEKTDDSIKIQLDKIEEDEIDQNAEDLAERPPVVTIMGHVDHGKTLLLDAIRQSNIVSGESGGITQHIGAYQIETKGKKITFLDTPGHAAFTSLRARGAQVTDIAILVVAADEGIKPQTVEAIHHAKAANVPIIVAINKMDKPEANPENVKQELAGQELVPEDWGGKTIVVPLSAKSKDGIDTLLEMILLTAEMQELKAIHNGLAKGIVIESRLSRQKGPIATILIKSGTLKIGHNFVIGTNMGKVKALFNDLGEKITEVPPGAPAEILGITGVPSPGVLLEAMASEKECRATVDQRLIEEKEKKSIHLKAVSFEALSQQVEDGEVKKLNLIVKADAHGSLEAILTSLEQIPTDEVAINIIHSGAGSVTENDVMLAKASEAILVGFHVETTSAAEQLAEKEEVQIRTYSIIYEILDDIKGAVSGLFKPEFEEVEIGTAEVRQIYKFSKVGQIAGSYVTSGRVIRNAIATVNRNGEEVYKGKISSLKRFKEDAKEVKEGFECGIVIDKSVDLQEGDVVHVFELSEKAGKTF